MALTDVPLILSEPQIGNLLTWEELLDEMETALIELSAGRVLQPIRTTLSLTEDAGWFGLMPCVYRDVIGAKLVTVFPRNVNLGLDTHQASIILFRRQTGEPLCVMDGRLITARRTAAVSALATRELSRKDAKVLAILGSGVQARTHLHALKMVRDFKEIRVWSRNPEHAFRFAEEAGATVMSAEQAVSGADVVITVTHTEEPVLLGKWLKEDVHVNAVGAVGPTARELDEDVVQNATVVVESRVAAERESAEIAQSGAAIYAELGEIFSGLKHKPALAKTVYKSLGVAVEDVAAARLVYEKAVKTNFY